MKNIALPQKIDFKKDKEPNKCSVIIEPCYPGYGMTLGSSIRRVLLSSLPGAAVIGVKIKGADHEFMSLPHVKEDVLEILLNLKKLHIRAHSDETIKLELDVAGEKTVKASDINKNAQVEIANPDLILAHITDMAGNLKMEILVSPGKGYETIESREKEEKKEIGYIEIDSIFSPVLAVGFNVESVRVGKMTNWDKLIIDITTNGTISPENAFNESVKILIEQFNSLIGEKKKIAEVTDEKKEEKEDVEEVEEKSSKDSEEKNETEKEKEIISDEVDADEPKKKRGRPKKI